MASPTATTAVVAPVAGSTCEIVTSAARGENGPLASGEVSTHSGEPTALLQS